MRRYALLCYSVTVALTLIPPAFSQQTRDEQVRSDRQLLASDESWYYDDLDAGLAEAREANKPLMVVLRCIP